ncbi:MAG: RNA 2',3'-cyclic phosphodiesterase [Candidatus Poribacteria bacterium]|nr:RNA 2',3'-cyclic phosphodiesterase [Candidatus Poribacteria bacterium]MDE0506098.1 RNA 2',3'-cyclic phosphodiesterase [Candidatus Poribacteria bacterium]
MTLAEFTNGLFVGSNPNQIPAESVNQEKIRCFVAIEIPDAVQALLASVQEELGKNIRAASWVKRGNIHLTLKFLGEIASNQINEVKNVMERVASARPPFSMEIGGIGVFPNLTRPRIIWAGVKTGADEIVAIANAVDIGLSRHGYERDEKQYRPHLTLARIKHRINVKPLAQMFRQYDTILGATVVVNQIRVVQSQLRPSGAVYTPLETCRFKSRSTTEYNRRRL